MFSIVIPVYNGEQTIKSALSSVENQTAKELVEEILVIDDGSTDATAACVKRQASESPIPIRLLRQKRKGPSAARNAGMRQARADYIAFLDADDEWELDKLARQAAVLRENPRIDLLCGGTTDAPLQIFLRTRKGLSHTTLREYCIKSFILTSTVVIRKARQQEVGYFNARMHHSEDMNFYQKFYRWNEVYFLQGKCMRYDPVGKHAQAPGLSDDLRKMHLGRRYNYYELFRDGMISRSFFMCMIVFGEMKYVRRRLIRRWMACGRSCVYPVKNDHDTKKYLMFDRVDLNTRERKKDEI